jgi:Cu/Ag efflux protein CusF
MIRVDRIPAVLASMALVALVHVPAASAQQTRSQAAPVVTKTFTIVAIDQTDRIITLKDKDGYTDSLYAEPEVQRFNELKVGDKVTFRYRESVVYQIQKPGASAAAGVKTGITRSTGPTPGGTIAQQVTAMITIQAIDAKTGTVTVKTDDGEVTSFKVEDKKILEGVKPGERVQITYTQALAVSVEPAK